MCEVLEQFLLLSVVFSTNSKYCDMKSTKIFKTLMLPLVAVAVSLVSSGAGAVPMSYSVAYSGTTVGPSGTGSFSWDADTSSFNAFNWNFSPVADTLMANSWRSSIFGGTMGQFLFEILTGEDVHPSACSANSRCSFSSFNVQSGSLSSVEFRTLGAGLTEYVFRNGSNVLFSGMLSIARATAPAAPGLAVSEPLSLALIGVGLLGLAVRRRKSVA
jgi:hypothetical protein